MKSKVIQWGFASFVVFLTSILLASAQAPYIIDQPTNQTVTAGETATFSVAAGGAAPLSYQWFFDTTNLVGTNATLILYDVTSANAGPYYAQVENAYGSTNSRAADLRVNSSNPSQAPYFISQPTNQTVTAGGTAVFSVTAGGTAPLSYQWYSNGTNIQAATNATLILNDVTPANAGPYYVTVENAYGSTNSATATLTVDSSSPGQPPYIIDEPTNETVTVGGTAILSVDAGGTAPLSYQWYFDETNVVGTNATLIITNATPADAGPYFVSVENAYGSTNSVMVTLTVSSSFPGEAPYIIDQPTNQTVASGGTATFSVIAGGAAPLSYQWYFNTTNLVGTNATLVLNDVTAADAGPYYVMVENAYGSTNSVAADLTVTSSGPPQAPYIIVQPTNETVTAGAPAMFTVDAGGSGPLSYQWYFDETNLVGTNATLIITNTTSADAGGYFVTVENAYGSTNSATAILTVNSSGPSQAPYIIAQPTNETVAAGGTATFSAIVGGAAPLSYQWYFNETNLVGTNATLVLNDVTAADAGPYYVMVENAYGSTNSVAADLTVTSSGPPQAPYIIVQPTNETVTAGAPAKFTVDAGGSGPLSYQWYFDETNVVGTNATLIITNAEPADAGPYFVMVENAYGSTNSATATLTVNSSSPGQAPYIIDQPTNQTVASGGRATFSVIAGGAAPLSYQWYFNETNLVGTNETLVLNDVTAADAGPYYVMVENAYGSTNSHAADLTVTSSGPPQAPYIIVQPTNETVTAGAPAMFTVIAGGTGPLSYQWYFDETNVVGTNATLIITNTTSADAGGYFVTVENAYGSTNSATAILTVNSSSPGQAPYIIDQPTNQTVVAGNTATFSVTSGGTAPLSYQWYSNGTNIQAATNATLVIPDVTPANAGPYYVAVENAYGSTNSETATLTVTSSGPSPNVPVITAFSPALGSAGTPVEVSGLNFSPITSNNIVYFGAVRASVQAASATELLVNVPAGATYAPITETVSGLTAYANQPFVPTFPGCAPTNFSVGSQSVLAAGNGPSGVVIGDFDGDGKPDLAVNNGDSHTIEVYRNISTNGTLTASSFAPPVVLPIGTGGQNVMVAADLTGDGKLDLICLDLNSNLVMVLKNLCTPGIITSNSFAPAVNFVVGTGPRGVAVQDLDGDGKPEIVSANWGDNSLSVLRNLSTPGSISANSFAPAVSFATGTNPQNVMIADIDGDGQPDLVSVNNNYSGSSSSLSVLRNISTPTNLAFASHVDFSGLQDTYCLAIGDLDGDGKPDVVIGSQPGGQSISLYRNTSTPGSISTNSFAPHADFAAGGWVNSVALGDLNGDGKLDVAAALQIPSQMDVFLNTSTPGSISNNSFAPPLVYAAGYNANGIAIGDLNGDGAPDIAFANSYDGTLSIYQNTTPICGGTSPGETVDHFTWNPIPSPRFRAVPFTVTITARDAGGAIVTNFAGTVHINLTNGMPVIPPILGNFVYGSSTGMVIVPLPGTNLVLKATDVSGHTGFSNPFNVVNLPVLTPTCCSNMFQVTWPVSTSGFVLEMTTNLASGNWVPVTGQPLQSSNQCMQAITPTNTNNIPVFYRLHYMGQ